MDRNLEKAFKKVIPEFIPIIESRSKLGSRTINRIKKKIKEELPNPKVSVFKKDIARFVLIYQIESGVIKDKEEFNNYYPKSNFILNNLEKAELDTISDTLLTDFDEEEDDLSSNFDETIQKYYLTDDPDWFIQIGLKEDPFPSQDGLYLISKNDYEDVVLKTEIYNKYIESLEQNPKWILNKSIVIYGDFGCGKTTFFDYLDYKLLLKNIQPIRIILNALPSLTSLHQKFNESLFYELSSYLSKYSKDPRGEINEISQFSILLLFNKIQTERELRGFVIFLDGLHKSQDQKNTALEFLIELQNILEFYRRKGIALTILIAGSLEWREKIDNSKIFSGSIFTLDKMDSLNVTQSYEMLKRRFTVFSEIKGIDFLKFKEVELLVTSIEQTLATEINYRLLIKYFLQNGFIFRNKIKIKPFIEEDVLSNIYGIIRDNKLLFNNLIEIKKKFEADKPKLSKILRVISSTYDMGYFFPDHTFYKKNVSWFDYLRQRNIIGESEKYKKEKKKPYALNPSIYKTFKEIENKVKFRPTHYMELLFIEEPKPIESKAEYTKILDAIKRFKVNNPEFEGQINKLITLAENRYFASINKIENAPNFQITSSNLSELNEIIEELLRFIYDLSEEPLKFENQNQLFSIFKYTWLDNQILTQYFNWIDNWNPIISDTTNNKHFLKLFIDTFESLIFKIGKHILYNKILVVGSKFLNNDEKIELNAARAFYSGKQYKMSVEKCHDLLENTLRSFIFNILYLKYGNNWENFLPEHAKNYIIQIKMKEKKQYGELLSQSGNSLYYLSRSAYSTIIDDKFLWKSCFSILFGKAYRTFIKETLENLANLGHLDKHNRNDEEFAKIASLIVQNLSRSKEVIERINKSYLNLITLKNFIIEDNQLIPHFQTNERIEDLDPIKFNDTEFQLLLETIRNFKMNSEYVIDQCVDLSDMNRIQDIFSIPYRKFLGMIIYLISKEVIEVSDYYGSKFLFSVL